MNLTSLGFRTDLALLQRAGSTVEDRVDHLVVRSPHNPSFYWGNFLLLKHVPAADLVEAWLERFEAEFPDARHRTFGFDHSGGTVDDISGFAQHGFNIEAASVMTATSVRAPARPNTEATYRAFESDTDWAQSVELRMSCDDSYEPVSHREFVTRRAESNRALVAAGHGQWFGAFIDEALVTQMGLVTASPGLARFQSVETHPDQRGSGLAGNSCIHGQLLRLRGDGRPHTSNGRRPELPRDPHLPLHRFRRQRIAAAGRAATRRRMTKTGL